MLLKFNHNHFFKLLSIFIVIQPILDILTFLSLRHTNFSITIGIVIRVLFLSISIGFIIFGHKTQLKKYIIIYLTVLFSVMGISNGLNYFFKPNFLIFEELQFTTKALYYSVMFCSILLAIQSKSNSEYIMKHMIKLITISMSIFATTFLISILTNTSTPTYKFGKEGFSGWFFAGNEISAIVAICFPLVFIYFLKNTLSLKNIKHWLPALLLAITGIFIGTKVSFLAIIVTITLITSFNLCLWALKISKTGIKNVYSKHLRLSGIFVIILIFLIPFSPGFNNIQGDYTNISETIDENDNDSKKEDGKKQTPRQDESNTKKGSTSIISESGLVRTLLSSRNVYFESILLDYSASNTLQKFFGIGYAGYYEDEEDSKMIEMDFFDLFFSFGIIGSVLILLPLFITFYNVFKEIFYNTKTFLTIENLLLLLSTGLGMGISFVAGHVLFAPAVSIYLTISLVLLLNNTSFSIKNKN
ncbi:O-antigen ligase family protein [Virgibacillus sp. JSM 102003]|uniref:O-antigen ligase family protein n=1 Tax=Virgibacillus sp. JSM 102003 TaxID=1562108 RepID=UPI0035BFA2B2